MVWNGSRFAAARYRSNFGVSCPKIDARVSSMLVWRPTIGGDGLGIKRLKLLDAPIKAFDALAGFS
jgi:hypothetical protein